MEAARGAALRGRVLLGRWAPPRPSTGAAAMEAPPSTGAAAMEAARGAAWRGSAAAVGALGPAKLVRPVAEAAAGGGKPGLGGLALLGAKAGGGWKKGERKVRA